MFVTSEGHPGARLQRALAVGNLTAAEQAAFEIPFITQGYLHPTREDLSDALAQMQVVRLPPHNQAD